MPTLSTMIPAGGLVPTELHFGSGSFGRVAGLTRRLGRRALLVTSPRAMDRLGYTEKLTADLEREGVAVTPFSRLRPSPTTDDVDRGAALARQVRADVVIGLGGGSPMDCAKAIAAVAAGNRPAVDYLDGEVAVDDRALSVVAVPTTSGTGSEMNPSAIVTDRRRRVKNGIRSRHLFPRYAVVDPDLTLSLGRTLTARTAFDALSHAIESYVSPKAQPETDELALRAMRAIGRFLPVALEEPGDEQARAELALASAAMGVNLARVGTCLPHRLDKALCALHPEIPHGQSVALFYPWWIRCCCRAGNDRFAKVAEAIRPETERLPAGGRAAALGEILEEFLGRIGLDRRPADFGVTEDEIPALCERVAGDLSVNPIPVSREELPAIFRAVLRRT